MTCHAAFIARGYEICSVVGCGGIRIDQNNRKFTLNGKTFIEGDITSIEGIPEIYMTAPFSPFSYR